jgi:hypothetical protein
MSNEASPSRFDFDFDFDFDFGFGLDYKAIFVLVCYYFLSYKKKELK